MKTKETFKESYVFAEIPLDMIDTEGQSVREAEDTDHVIQLAMSISKHGLLEPIVVQQIDGRYQLLAGFHRLAAFSRLRKKVIPAHIKNEYTGPVKAIALVENICRLDMTLKEQVIAVDHLVQTEGLSISQIQELTGKSRDWVLKRLMALSLPEDTREYLFDGLIGLQQAEILGGIEDEASRKYLTNVVIQQKLSRFQVEELAKLYQEHANIADAVAKGLEKKEENDAEKIPMRTCDHCGKRVPLVNISFVAVCANGCKIENEEG